MSPFAANLTDGEMADLAAYYAAQRPRPRPAGVDPAKLADGKRIAEFTTARPATARSSPATSRWRAWPARTSPTS